MRDKVFLDSNILVYCSDGNNIQKQNIARTLIESLVRKNKGQISTQTLQAFFNVVTRKLKSSKKDTQRDVEKYAKIFPVHTNNLKDILSAIGISIKTQFSFYDSLIIAAAKSEGCSIVYSEDLNDGQTVDGVKIVNPFADM